MIITWYENCNHKQESLVAVQYFVIFSNAVELNKSATEV